MLKRYLIALLLLLPTLASAELVIVTNSQSAIASLTDNEARQLFSGQLRSIGGQRIQPLDLPANNASREHFYRTLTGRSPEQMRAYWTRLIFTGQGQPPREVSGYLELTSLISSSSEYIGYLPASEVNDRVRVIYRLK